MPNNNPNSTRSRFAADPKQGSQLDFYKVSRENTEIPHQGPTESGIVNDPGSTQTSFQSTGTNWWNELMQNVDQNWQGYYQGQLPFLEGKLRYADQHGLTDVGGESLQSLQDQKTKLLQNINNEQTEINSEPVDMDYQQKTNAMSNSGGGNMASWDYIKYQMPQNIGGTLSMVGAMVGQAALPMGLSAAAEAVGGGPEAALAAGIIGFGTGAALELKNRQFESYGEVAQAYQQKLSGLVQDYRLLNGKEPEGEDLEQMKDKARVGLKELFDRNNTLMLNDYAELALAAIPLWDGAAAGLKATRLGRNLTRLGAVIGDTGVQSMEEGQQQYWQNEYAAGHFQDKDNWLTSLPEHLVNYAQSVGEVAPSMLAVAGAKGFGDPDLYNDPQFVQAIKGGFASGLLFGTGFSVAGAVKDTHSYNSALRALSPDAGNKVEDDFTRFKASTLYKLFSQDKQDFVYNAIDTMGKTGTLGMTPEQADSEIENVKELYKEYQGINNPTTGLLGKVWNALDMKAENRGEKRILEGYTAKDGTHIPGQKEKAFVSAALSKSIDKRIANLQDLKANTEQDAYGFISNATEEQKTELNKNLQSLGLSQEEASNISTDRFDKLIAANTALQEQLHEGINRIVSGKALVEARNFKKTLAEAKARGDELPELLAQYAIGENRFINKRNFEDRLKPAFVKADSEAIRKQVAGNEALEPILDHIIGTKDFGITKEAYSDLSVRAAKETASHGQIKQELAQGQQVNDDEDDVYIDPAAEEKLKRLKDEDSRMTRLKDKLNQAQANVVDPDSFKTKKDDEYRREFADSHLKETDAIASIPNNTQIDRINRQEKVLNDVRKAYDNRKDLHELPEFAGFSKALNDSLAKLAEIRANAEKIIHDRKIKDDRIAQEAITDLYSASGIKLTIGTTKGEIVAVIDPNSVAGKLLVGSVLERVNKILEEAKKEYTAKKELSSIYPELILKAIRDSVDKSVTEASIKVEEDAILDLFAQFIKSGNIKLSPGTTQGLIMKDAAAYVQNPEKLFRDMVRYFVSSSGIEAATMTKLNDALHEYFTNRDFYEFTSLVKGLDLPNLDNFLAVHKRTIALDALRTSTNSKFNIADQIATERAVEAARPKDVAPSKQQVRSIREFFRWFMSSIKPKTGYGFIAYLNAVAGTGKTTTAGIIKRLSGLKESEILLATNSKWSLAELAKATETNVAVNDFYKADSTVDELIKRLQAGDKSLEGVKLVILDEAGHLTYAQVKALSEALNQNKSMRVLALGDTEQIRGDNMASPFELTIGEGFEEMRYLPPLTIKYRTSVSEIEGVGEMYYRNPNTVTHLETRTNADHTYGVVTSKDPQSMIEELKTKEQAGTLKDGKTRLVIVNDDESVAYFKDKLGNMPVEVARFDQIPGRTVDEAYVYLRQFGNLKGNTEFNRAMYTSISRARNFAFVADANLKQIEKPQIRADIDARSKMSEQEFNERKGAYKEELASAQEALKALGTEGTSKVVVPTIVTPTPAGTHEAEEEEEVVETEGVEGPEELGKREEPLKGPEVQGALIKGDYEVWYPQATARDLETKEWPIKAGDRVIFVKAEDKNGVPHVRVLKQTAENEFVQIAIIGSEDKSVESELQHLDRANPEMARTIRAAMTNNGVQGTQFKTPNPKKPWLVTKNAHEKLSKILDATVKFFKPLTVKFSPKFIQQTVTQELKTKITEDVRKELLREGQVADKIEVKATIYTHKDYIIKWGNEERSESISSFTDKFPSQGFVVPGRPYIQVKVTLKNKTIAINIPCINQKLDKEKHAEFLKPIIDLHAGIGTIENLLNKGIGSELAVYGENKLKSGIFIGEEELSKGELFNHLRKHYSGVTATNEGANYMDKIARDVRYKALANLWSKITQNLSKEELEQLNNASENVDNLLGIREYKSRINEATLTDEQKVPKLHEEPVLTKTSNVAVVAEGPEDFTIYANNQGNLVAVKYYEYKGVYVKIKSGVEKIGDQYKLQGEVTANIQKHLDTTKEDYNIRRRVKVDESYNPEDFNDDNLVDTLESIFSKAGSHMKTLVGFRKGTGAAQITINKLARNNETLRVNKMTIATTGRKVAKQETTGKSLTNLEGTNVFNKELLQTVIDNNSPEGALYYPVKLEPTSDTKTGDNVDISKIETRYDGLSRTQVVLSDVKPHEATPVTKEKPAISPEEAGEKKGRRSKPKDSSGLLLSKTREVPLGRKITEQEAREAIRRFIPGITNEEVRFVGELEMMRLTEGNEAWGAFKNGIIYFLKGADGSTRFNIVRHEVFHRAFHMSTSSLERSSLLEAVRKAVPELASAPEVALEEYLAERFQVFHETKQSKHGFLRDLFRKLLAFLGFIDQNQHKIDEYFRRLDRGGLTTNTTNPKVLRLITRIRKRFGSINNYNDALNLLISKINNLTIKYMDEEGKPLPVYFEGEFRYIHRTFNEAAERVIESIQLIVNKYKDNADAVPEDIRRDFDLYRLILNPHEFDKVTNLDALMAIIKKSSAGEDLDEAIGADVLDADERANLSDEINESDLVNLETTVTANLTNFFSTFQATKWIDEENKHFGYKEQIPTWFTNVRLAQAFSNLSNDANNELLLAQLNHNFAKLGISGRYMAEISKQINQLEQLKSTKTYIDAEGKSRKLPTDMSFKDENDFVIGNNIVARRKKITDTGRLETTSDFYLRIANIIDPEEKLGDGVYNLIDAMNRKQWAEALWREMVSHYISQRKKAPYDGTVVIEKGDFGSRSVTFHPKDPINANVTLAHQRNIEGGLRASVEDNSLQAFAKNWRGDIQEAKKSKYLEDFFKLIGLGTAAFNKDNKGLISIVAKDTQELIKDLLATPDKVDDVFENSKGRLSNLANLLTTEDLSDRATGFIDQKNRKRYNWIQHSFATRQLDRIVSFFEKVKQTIYKTPLFDLPFGLKRDQLRLNNIFLNGTSTLMKVRDYGSSKNKDADARTAIEYFKESPSDIDNRRFNLNFIAKIAEGSKRGLSYYQNGHVLSDRNQALTTEVELLNEQKLKKAILGAMRYELGRRAYIENLPDINGKANLSNVETWKNYVFFGLNRNITDAERNNEEALAKEAYLKIVNKARLAFGRLNTKTIDARYKAALDNLEKSNSLVKFGLLEDMAEPDMSDLEKVFVTFYVNNYVNGYHLAHLYAGDQSQYKDWKEILKRMGSISSTAIEPYIGEGGMSPRLYIGVAADETFNINENTDYTGFLKKLRSDKAYESTDGWMLATPEAIEEFKKGFGENQPIDTIMKPLVTGMDEYGVVRIIKCSLVSLEDSLVQMFPELDQIRDMMRLGATIEGTHRPIDLMPFKSSFKVGAPIVHADARGTSFPEGSAMDIPSSIFKVQQKAVVPVEQEIKNFSQLLYFLNTNGLNQELTTKAYDFNKLRIKRGFDKLYKSLLDKNGVLDQSKVRNLVLSTLTKDGLITQGSERIYDLLSRTLSKEEKEFIFGDEKYERRYAVGLSMPSIVKKVFTQMSSVITSRAIQIDFSGSKLVLASSAFTKVYHGADGGILTYDKLPNEHKTEAKNFYSGQFSRDEQKALLKAREAKLFDAEEKVLAEYKDAPESLKTLLKDYFASGSDDTFRGARIPRRLQLARDPVSGDLYAEAIMPKNVVYDLAQRMGMTLDELKTTLIGVRIPTTGIHSSVPLRVVGWFESQQNNLIMVPDEIMPLHGSDLDVDSLFVIRREMYGEDVRDRTKVGEEKREPSLNASIKGKVYFTDYVRKLWEKRFDREKEERQHIIYAKNTKRDTANQITYDEDRHKKEFAAKYGIGYDPASDKFTSKNAEGKVGVFRTPSRVFSPIEQEHFDSLYKTELIDNPSLTKFTFAKNNNIHYDEPSDTFDYGSIILGKEGEAIGYDGLQIDNNFIDKLNEQIQLTEQALLDGTIKETNPDGSVNEKFAKRFIKAADELIDRYIDNAIIQIYLDIVTDPKNREDMNTPISQDISHKDVLAEVKDHLGVDDLFGERDLYDYHDQKEIQSLAMGGQALVGIDANTTKGLGYLKFSADTKGKKVMINYGEKTPIKMNGVDVVGLSNRELVATNGKQYNTWETMDSLINASIDSIKEQVIPAINMTSNNANAVLMLIACGVPYRTVVFMLRQPYIHELAHIFNKFERGQTRDLALKSLTDALKSAKNNVTIAEADDFVKEGWRTFFDTNEGTLALLKDGMTVDFEASKAGTNPLAYIESNVNALKTQIAAIKIFTEFEQIGEDVFSVTQGLSTLRNTPIDRASLDRTIEGLEKSTDKKFKLSNANLLDYADEDTNALVKGVPHIEETYDTLKKYKELIRTLLPQHSLEMDEFLDHFTDLTGTNDEREHIREEFVKYLFAMYEKYQPHSDEKYVARLGSQKDAIRVLTGNHAWIQNFVLKLNQFKRDHPELLIGIRKNMFLANLSVTSIYANLPLYRLVFNASTSLSMQERERIADDFEALPEEIKEGVLKYSVLVQGMSFGVTSYSNYISPEMQAHLSDFMDKTLSEIMRTPDKLDNLMEHFAIQYAYHNASKLHFLNTKKENVAKNQDTANDPSWTYSVTVKNENAPLVVAIGSRARPDVYVRVSMQTQELDENNAISTARYQKLGANRFGGSAKELFQSIYNANLAQADSKFHVTEKFSPDYRVETADPNLGAAPDAAGHNSLRMATVGEFATQRRYAEGQTVYLVDYYDIDRSYIYPYTVTKVTENPGNIEYSLQIQTGEVKEAKFIDDDKPFVPVTTDAIQTHFKALQRVFSKAGIQVALKINRNLQGVGMVNSPIDQTTGKTFIQIQVNPDKMNGYKAIAHEFAHIFFAAIGGINHPRVKEAIEQAKLQFPEEWQKVQRKYAPANQDEEILVRAISNWANTKGTISSKFVYKLKQLFRAIAEAFGLKLKRNLPKELMEQMFLGLFKNPDTVVSEKHDVGEENTTFKDTQKNVGLTPDEKNYINKLSNRVYKRVNDFMQETFSPWKSAKDFAEGVADSKFRGRDKENDTIRYKSRYINQAKEYTHKELVDQIAKDNETDKIRGKVVHKYIAYLIDPAKTGLLVDINEMIKPKDNQWDLTSVYARDAAWLADNWPGIADEAGISVLANAAIGRDVIQTEVIVANDELGIAGSVDLLVKHPDGTHSIYDIKSGDSLTKMNVHTEKIMKFAGSFYSDIFWNKRNQAKLQIMIYALLAKSMEPTMTFRNLSVLFCQRGELEQHVHPVQIEDFLGVLQEYFKTNNKEWYEANKSLFNPAEYGGSSKSVSEAIKENSGDVVATEHNYFKKIRDMYVQAQKLRKQGLKDESNAVLDRAGKKALESMEAHTSDIHGVGENLKQHTKDMSALRANFGNIYNVRDRLSQVYANFMRGRKSIADQYKHSLVSLHNEYLAPLQKEYNRGRTGGVVSNLTLDNLNFMQYKDMYGFMWTESSSGRKINTDTTGMTEAQKKYYDFYTKEMRNQYYLTMNPKQAIKLLEDDIAATSDEKLKNHWNETLDYAKTMPDIDKSNELFAFGLSGFEWTEDFSPMIPASKGERMEHGDAKSKALQAVKGFSPHLFQKDMVGAMIHTGVPVKYMRPIYENGDFYTMSTSIIFNNFVANMVEKRYMDDAYYVGKGLVSYYENAEDLEGNRMHRTSEFWDNQIMLNILHEKKETKYFTKEIRLPNGKRFSLDRVIKLISNATTSMILALNWKGGIIYGVMKTMFNFRESLVGSITKRLGIKAEDINWTMRDMVEAHKLWFDFQKDRMLNNQENNKVYNALRALSYTTNMHFNPVGTEYIKGTKNPILKSGLLYGAYSVPEQYSNGVELIAQLKHSGLWDKYNDKFEWIGGVRGVDKQGNKIYGLTGEEITRIKHVSSLVHGGGWREDEKMAMELYWWGRMLAALHRFFPTMISQTWGSRYNTDALGKFIEKGASGMFDENGKEIPIFEWEGRISEGKMRTFLKYLGVAKLFNRLFFSSDANGNPVGNYKWRNLSPEQKANVVDIYVQIGIYGTLVLAGSMLFGDGKDDDPWENRYHHMQSHLIQGWNVMDILKVGANPTVAMPALYHLVNGTYTFVFSSAIGGDRTKAGGFKGTSEIKQAIPAVKQVEDLIPGDRSSY